MSTRRKFLQTGGLTAAAFLAAKPMKLMAAITEPFLNAGKVNSLVILHTSCRTAAEFSSAAALRSLIKAKGEHILLLNASGELSVNDGLSQQISLAGYDAVLATEAAAPLAGSNIPFVLSSNNTGAISLADNVQIVSKGDMKIGIIGAAAAFNRGAGIINRINELAEKLKKENGCDLVICLSSLGYRERKISDRKLAKGSRNIDVIISANNEKPVPAAVLHNLNGEEVLLDNAGAAKGAGKLEIRFNDAGLKNYIAFGSQSLQGSWS